MNLNVQANYAIGVFRDDKFVLTPLQKFQQVRPSFQHVDLESKKREIKTKDQLKSEKDAAEKLTRIGIAKTGAEAFGDIIDTKWVTISTFDP